VILADEIVGINNSKKMNLMNFIFSKLFKNKNSEKRSKK
jgi:hypothetical protein